MTALLRKDLIALLRLRRMVAIQLVFVAIIAVLVLSAWPQRGVAAIANRAQDDLVLWLVLGQVVLLALCVPGAAAVAVTGEREANTLEMLYASQLSPLEIAIAKTLSVVGYPLLLIIAGLPLAAMLSLRGAVDFRQLLWGYLLLLLAAAVIALISLLISTFCRQNGTALLLSYLVVLVLCGATLVPAAVMLATQSGLPAEALHYLRALSPIAAELSLLRPGSAGDYDGRLHGLLPLHSVYLISGAIIAGICVVATVLRLARPPTDRTTESNRARPGMGVLYLINPQRKRSAIRGSNPVFMNELRTNRLRSGGWMLRIFYGALVLGIGLALMSLYGGSDHPDLLNYVAQILVAFQFGVVALVVPSLTSTSVSTEIENQTLDLLRMTPLGTARIFWGKLLAGCLPAMLPIVALLPAYAAVCYIDPSYIPYLLRLVPVLLLSVLFCCVVGLFCSSMFATAARSSVVSYLIIALVFFVPLLAWIVSGRQLSEQFGAYLAALSPLALGLGLIDMQAQSLTLAALWPMHLLLMAAACLVLSIATEARLSILLHIGGEPAVEFG